MKNLVLALFCASSFSLFSQFDEGHYYFISSTHYLTFNVTEGGENLSEITLVDLESYQYEMGTGYWHKVNMNGVDANYSGPEGFYEFQTEQCSYSFDMPTQMGDIVDFERYDCDNAGSLYLTQTTEIEAGLMLQEMSEASIAEEAAMSEEEFSDPNFDASWVNAGYDDIEAQLLPWVTKTGVQLQETILKFQPTLEDCKKVFSDEDYITVFASVTAAYAEMMDDINKNSGSMTSYSYVRVQPLRFESPAINLYPRKGPYDLRNPLLNYYEFSFLESENSEYGRSLTFLVELDGRYVIFPQD